MANDVSNGNAAASKANKITVVLGAQWGDEGKGKLVDLVAKDFDVIARCQGGNNAGHTVVVGDKAYDFHLLPSGIIWEGKVSLIGNGVVVHVPQLFEELEKNEAKGLSGWEERLKISDKAHLVFDFHQASDGFQEEERTRNSAGGKGGVTTEMLGTTKKGIGPAYSSKANRNGLRVSDLVGDFEEFTRKFGILADCYMARYPALKVDKEAEMARYKKYAERIRPMVAETISYIHDNVAEGKTVLVEGANASMLDIDFGTYPFVTSSNCSIGGVCTGLGVPPGFIGDVFGVVKAYTTRVGVGPFMTELTDDLGAFLQSHGKEFGVTTGRARRCGWLDIPLLRYTSMINGYTAVAMTKLDILDELDEIKIGVKYIKNGEPMKHFPSAVQDFDNVTVEYVTLPGWKTGIADCRSFAALPEKAQSYVKEVERLLGVPVRWIGVGQARDAVIDRQREES